MPTTTTTTTDPATLPISCDDDDDRPPRRVKSWSEMTNAEAAQHIIACWKMKYFDEMFDGDDDD